MLSTATLALDPAFQVGPVSPRFYSSFIEHLGKVAHPSKQAVGTARGAAGPNADCASPQSNLFPRPGALRRPGTAAFYRNPVSPSADGEAALSSLPSST